MPNQFHNSKIYKVYTLFGDEIYIGCTTMDLKDRIRDHQKRYKAFLEGKLRSFDSLFRIFEKYGVENALIEVIENVNCESSIELFDRKRVCAESYPNCVNAYRTKSQREKDRYQRNKKLLKLQSKINYYENRQQILESRKIQTKVKLYTKLGMQDFVDKVITCECGSIIEKRSLDKHLKTNKHLSYIKARESDKAIANIMKELEIQRLDPTQNIVDVVEQFLSLPDE